MRSSVEGLTASARRATLLMVLALAAAAAQTAIPKASPVRTHLQRAQAALTAHDTETATQEFRAVLTLDPRNAEAHVNLGVIAFSQGDVRTASEHLRKALAIQPSLTQAQALLGICEKRLGSSSAQRLLESSFAKLTDTNLRTQVGKELIGLYYQRGDSERAIPVIQKLVDLNPDNVEILYMAQRLYKELADDTLDKLAVLAPGSARMQQVIAERLINAGDAESAIDHFKKALEIDPKLPGVRFELAQAILESARSNPAVQDEAEKEFESAITAEGDSASLQCALGGIAMLRSDSDKAFSHYTRAFSMDPGSTQAQLGLGQVLMTMEKPEEARKYLEMAVKSDPLNGTAHYRLASAYKRLQMPDQAQKEMRLFQEIKDTKDQVRKIYRQMKSQYHTEPGGMSDSEE
ncbi:MAG: tetratricopeptide repeat protein [Acidobacteriia bacterium]|nr:tetratricopeptide repeat protein [Terriglobia bacterium]